MGQPLFAALLTRSLCDNRDATADEQRSSSGFCLSKQSQAQMRDLITRLPSLIFH